MITPRLLEIICCPETHQPLKLAPPELIQQLNAKVQNGKLHYKSGKSVDTALDNGLIRADGTALFPVRNDLPELLVEKSIPLT